MREIRKRITAKLDTLLDLIEDELVHSYEAESAGQAELTIGGRRQVLRIYARARSSNISVDEILSLLAIEDGSEVIILAVSNREIETTVDELMVNVSKCVEQSNFPGAIRNAGKSFGGWAKNRRLLARLNVLLERVSQPGVLESLSDDQEPGSAVMQSRPSGEEPVPSEGEDETREYEGDGREAREELVKSIHQISGKVITKLHSIRDQIMEESECGTVSESEGESQEDDSEQRNRLNAALQLSVKKQENGLDSVLEEVDQNGETTMTEIENKSSNTFEKEPFGGFDFSEFWDDSEYALSAYVCEPPSDQLIAEVEAELGYQLPKSYVWLMKQHNGGIPVDTCFPSEEPTSWAEDHVAVTGIFGIGRDKQYSLCGKLGSRFMIEEWGYPNLGIAVCDCPSGGHDMIFLDYRECGPTGEPCVVHIDQERDYEITWLAENFEEFICGLVNEDDYDTSEDEKEEDLELAAHGELSPLLSELCRERMREDELSFDLEQTIRALCTCVIEEKGYFALHADERSTLLYDIQFWLYTSKYPETSEDAYLEAYPKMLACAGVPGKQILSTGGYAPSFVTDWMRECRREGKIISRGGMVRFSDEAKAALIAELTEGVRESC